jgi:hypothetical protein
MTPVISLCHSTARLPNGWIKAYQDWMRKADKPWLIEYVLGVDEARLNELLFSRDTVPQVDKTKAILAVNVLRQCAVDGWNATVRKSSAPLLFTVSDDWFPPEHWDTALLKAIPDLDGDYVVDVDNQDGSYPLLPFSILTRGYLNRLMQEYGYSGFFYREYFGMMADCEFTDLARQDRVVVDARYLKFTHVNPENDGQKANAGTAEWDDVYRWQRRPEATQRGKEVYVRRVQQLRIKKPGFVPLEVLRELAHA